MASQKVIQYDSAPNLTCDVCGSTNIIQTNEGYTCGACAIVLDQQRFQYHHPYNASIIPIYL